MSYEERLVELEVRATFQENLNAELSDVLREFAARVELLESRLAELKHSLDAPDVGPADDPPPHY